jgi:hypothetical protein
LKKYLSKHIKNMFSNYETLANEFNSKTYSDIIIRFENYTDKSFYVHKSILYKASPFFKKILQDEPTISEIELDENPKFIGIWLECVYQLGLSVNMIPFKEAVSIIQIFMK